MKKRFLILLAIGCTGLATAHEFWLMPVKFYCTIRETSAIRFQVGEHFAGENWKGNRDKVASLLHYTPSGDTIDVSESLSKHTGDSLLIPLREEGTHMVTFNSTNSYLSLSPDSFHTYLAEDGLMDALAYRNAHQENQERGKEYYQRSVKTIFQVGGKYTNACTQPTNLPLDIVPEENPYSAPGVDPGNQLPEVRFRIYFKGKPLVNTLVKTWYKDAAGNQQMASQTTNNRGWVTVKRHSGYFMVSTVYMLRLQNDPKADWQSYWASLTFEYSQFFAKGK